MFLLTTVCPCVPFFQMLSKRRIACLEAMEGIDPKGGTLKAIEALQHHLEVYYSDPEAWQELVNLQLEHGR